MRRAVYIGGFGCGRDSAERVANALSPRYDDVDPFTFVDAMKDRATVERAVRGADVITHSAGMLALKGTRPEGIGAIGAPLPSSPAKLILKSFVKTARMHTPGIGIRRLSDVAGVAAYDTGAVREFVTHGRENLSHLGDVAKFSSVDAAIAAKASGIDVMLGYNSGDEFFQLTHDEALRAVVGGVYLAHMPGVHDQLLITPDRTLADFLDVPAGLIGGRIDDGAIALGGLLEHETMLSGQHIPDPRQ